MTSGILQQLPGLVPDAIAILVDQVDLKADIIYDDLCDKLGNGRTRPTFPHLISILDFINGYCAGIGAPPLSKVDPISWTVLEQC